MSEQPLFSLRNPWFSASVGVTVVIAVLSAFAGLIWLPLAQPDLKLSGIWDAICSAAGVPRVSQQANSVQLDFKTSNVVMTSEMLTRHDQSRSAAVPRWRSAAPSATARKASATPIRQTSPGSMPPSLTRSWSTSRPVRGSTWS